MSISKVAFRVAMSAGFLSVLALALGHRSIRYFATLEMIPGNDSLRSTLQEADRFAIFSTTKGAFPDSEDFPFVFPQLLFTCESESQTKRLIDAIEIVQSYSISFWDIPGEIDLQRCLCHGDFTLIFYAGKRELAVFSFHHRKAIRWNNGPWAGDAELESGSGDNILRVIAESGFPAVFDYTALSQADLPSLSFTLDKTYE